MRILTSSFDPSDFIGPMSDPKPGTEDMTQDESDCSPGSMWPLGSALTKPVYYGHYGNGHAAAAAVVFVTCDFEKFD